jgi:nitrogen fixation/metabolism regulation signal transduction histidine kinase
VLDLGLFQSWLSPEVYLDFLRDEDVQAVEERTLGGQEYLVAYRRLPSRDVLAVPTPLASGEIARRQRDFADLLLLISLAGAGLSLVLSLFVGRALSRPIDQLSRAALAVGSGDLAVRLPAGRADEFGGVYRAFNRMVQRLRGARAALLRETRRTEAILAEAGTGVLALDAHGRIALVNPRAREILDEAPLATGARLPESGGLVQDVAEVVRDFLGSDDAERGTEIEREGRMLRVRLRRLAGDEAAGGAVLALEDITDEIRTARVLAWGEMARQVAHEIKNPLTPIKLAVQHLRRAWADGRPDYGVILERNVEAILREIDRLSEIARAFARFGTPGDAASAALEPTDLRAVADETLALYRGGGRDGIRYLVEVDREVPPAYARAGELKEVLINLLENARDALDGRRGTIAIRAGSGAEPGTVVLEVYDSGEGIAPELLPRIFDPQFSTRTRGTGLGLAIVRRLVESWGGEVGVDSSPGAGTTIRMRLNAAGE